MIWGSLSDTQQNEDLSPRIQACLRYAQEHDASCMEPGKYEMQDEALMVVSALQTVSPQERPWEAHRAYIDVHLVLNGTERIDCNRLSSMECGTYAEQEDFLSMTGEARSSVVLQPGDFLVCYPGDAHKPGLFVSAPAALKKAVFKVKV